MHPSVGFVLTMFIAHSTPRLAYRQGRTRTKIATHVHVSPVMYHGWDLVICGSHGTILCVISAAGDSRIYLICR
jgi:hypothetical protein